MTADQAMLTRRDALKGLAGILLAGVAPFFVPAQNLMRIKPIILPGENEGVFPGENEGVLTWELWVECLSDDRLNTKIIAKGSTASGDEIPNIDNLKKIFGDVHGEVTWNPLLRRWSAT